MGKIEKSLIRRILVITLSNIGDIILTTPVVETLLKEFPESRLDILVGPNGKAIYENYAKINDIIIYDKKSTLMEKFKLFLMLRKRKYDLVADLRHTIFPLILGARFNTKSLRPDTKNPGHRKELHLSRLKEFGIDMSKAGFNIPIGELDKENAKKLLGPLGGKPFVVVSPGAKSHVKRWPLKNFARLCDRMKKELGYEIILIGDENDRVVIERVLFYMKTKPLNLIEKTNIRELAYLIKNGKLLITNDSAPLHVGSAVSARILAFFGPTDAGKYGPVTDNPSRVLQKKLKCAPCEVAQCLNKENKYECLKTISADEAFEAAKWLLAK